MIARVAQEIREGNVLPVQAFGRTEKIESESARSSPEHFLSMPATAIDQMFRQKR